jgi:hypothetical protein
MKSKPVIKYIRYEDNRLIIVPTKEGLDIVGKLGTKGEDTIGGAKVIAFITEFESPIIFFRCIYNHTQNVTELYVYTKSKLPFTSKIPTTVKVADEEKKAE